MKRSKNDGESNKLVYVVPDEIRSQTIESLQVKKEVIEYLRENGYVTIEDVIQHQDRLPKKVIVPIRAKLMFNLDL